MRTIQATSAPSRALRAAAGRFRQRPLGLLAIALVVLEAAAGGLSGEVPALSALLLVVAPGLALLPLLPSRALAAWGAGLAAAPALGFAASSVALITVASTGIALEPLTIRLTLAVVVLAGVVVLPPPEPRVLPRREDAAMLAGLVAALGAGLVLQQRVIGGSPVPGNDWAKYLLYADEIRRHGSLLIDNPFFMLGVPFREDPGVPALYGSYLELSGQSAQVLVHGIWAFAVMGILSTFAFVRAWWGRLAAAIAAGLVAVLPISHDLLAWHGLANAAALALIPLVLLYVPTLVSGGLSWPEAGGLGLLLVALAATHRLSLMVALAAVAATLALTLLAGQRSRILSSLARLAVAVVVIGPGVAYDLVSRQRTFGGTPDYTAYLDTKVNLGSLAGDLTVPFTVAAIASVVLAVRWCRRERTLLVLLCSLAVIAALAYGWIVHFPLVYFRMDYYLPAILASLVAIALVRLLRPVWAAAVGGALAALVAAFAWPQAANVRDFYAFSNPASLRGLDAVAARLAPHEVVVTDRCWSFQATWLLHTPTLPALEPEDIQPKAELTRAAQARAVLEGSPAGRRLARRLGIRYLLVDPTCVDAKGRPARPPTVGVPQYVSKRLVVLRVPGSR